MPMPTHVSCWCFSEGDQGSGVRAHLYSSGYPAPVVEAVGLILCCVYGTARVRCTGSLSDSASAMVRGQ